MSKSWNLHRSIFIWIALKKSSSNHENGPCRWGEESMFKFDTNWIKKNVLWVGLHEGIFIFLTFLARGYLRCTYIIQNAKAFDLHTTYTHSLLLTKKIQFCEFKSKYVFISYIYFGFFPLILEINAYPILVIS